LKLIRRKEMSLKKIASEIMEVANDLEGMGEYKFASVMDRVLKEIFAEDGSQMQNFDPMAQTTQPPVTPPMNFSDQLGQSAQSKVNPPQAEAGMQPMPEGESPDAETMSILQQMLVLSGQLEVQLQKKPGETLGTVMDTVDKIRKAIKSVAAYVAGESSEGRENSGSTSDDDAMSQLEV